MLFQLSHLVILDAFLNLKLTDSIGFKTGMYIYLTETVMTVIWNKELIMPSSTFAKINHSRTIFAHMKSD